MADIVERLTDVLGPGAVLVGDDISPDYTHDEGLRSEATVPLAVVRPATTADVSEILRLADQLRVPVVARGRGTGLCGGAVPVAGGLLVAFDRMTTILEIDVENSVAVVQAGVTLDQLERALLPVGLIYPVSPGESSASLGGNVSTNAGGMRAIRYGVTRHHVLGLEAVLAGGQVIRTGGKFVKSSSGLDLTQLIVGSEGTLALVTEVTVKVQPRLTHPATVLAPYPTLATVTTAVPRIVDSGVAPLILEYLDEVTMSAITGSAGLALTIPDEVRAGARAYLVVVLESHRADRLDEDVAGLGELLGELGALDVYVLPPAAGSALIAAREQAFYVSRSAGADDIVDAVVPRAAVPGYLAAVGDLAAEAGARIAGCGHVGDGNVHISIFQPDAEGRARLLQAIMRTAHDLGGAVSGEHGIGTAKLAYFEELEDPATLTLMRRIKTAFDPHGLLGPGRMLTEEVR